MMTTVKRWAVLVGVWLATWGGWTPAPCSRAHLPADEALELVCAVVRDIAARFPEAPGPVKAREALRVLLNVLPAMRTRDLNLLIELALQQ